MTPQTLYTFNSSQDVIHLQTKYALFPRVANIVFSITIDDGFDRELMHKAINLLIERNDCLRTVFVKENKEIKQYFREPWTMPSIKEYKFDTQAQLESFIKKFRKDKADCFKGETLFAAFAVDPAGRDAVFFKVSHFVADTYGIGVLMTDLMAVYGALKAGAELPAAPGAFEEVLKKDNAFRADDEAKAKDREFFNEYYTKTHPDRPIYCGLHGETSDRWMKYKKKGHIECPYLFVKCDTEGYRFVIPAAVTEKVEKWCEQTSITMSTFFMYCCSIACSVRNAHAKHLLPLELLNCRGTLAERKAAGTKVQAVGVYTTIDYEKSFNENIKEYFSEKNQIFRHTRLSYLEMEALQHSFWNFPMTGQLTPFSFSFIPMVPPKGTHLQVHSNGKGALVAYIAMMLNIETKEIEMVYDIQTRMIKPQVLVDYQNDFIHIVEAVVANPDTKMGELF